MTYISTKMKKDIEINSIVTIHYFEYVKDIVFKGESHNFWELLYVDKGEVSVRAGNEWYTLSAGEVIFHEPNEFHAFKSIGKKAPNLVAISFYSTSPAINLFRRLYCTLTLDERTLISRIIAEARTAFSSPLHHPAVEQLVVSDSAPFGSQQLISLYLELFLITLKRSHLGSFSKREHVLPSINSPASQTAKQTLFKQICTYMDMHVCDNLSISAICGEFSVGRTTLHEIFRSECGQGAIEYFNNLKIEYAKETIRSGMMNFTEIAHYLSYSSLQYFSKRFKKVTGMSPLEYSSSVKGISQAFRGRTD